MTTINISEIELLVDTLSKTASHSDEWLNRLRGLYTEMKNDVELATYPQCDIILQHMHTAITNLEQSNDTLQSLGNALINAPDLYRENEKKIKEVLNCSVTYLDCISAEYNVAISSNTIPIIDCLPNENSNDSVQNLVANSLTEMQMTNISAISKTVKEEYEVKSVQPLMLNVRGDNNE